MIIAIASGKGGTGKTTLAVNLATMMPGPVTYADCDVEEPNGHIFLNPLISEVHEVGIPTPVVDKDKCTGCGACAQACRYKAIACIRGKVLIFSELCHGCGGCTLACSAGAISEKDHVIGEVETGSAGSVSFVQGRLKIGAAMAPPIIRAAKAAGVRATEPGGTLVIDAPPGTSCPMIAAVKDSDFVVLVTEPTPFGLNDLKLAVDTVRQLSIPFGVVINRSTIGDARVVDYCRREGILLLAEIPDSRRIAEAYSQGHMAVQHVVEMRPLFIELSAKICAAALQGASR